MYNDKNELQNCAMRLGLRYVLSKHVLKPHKIPAESYYPHLIEEETGAQES